MMWYNIIKKPYNRKVVYNVPRIDIPTKRLIQICPSDWVKAVLPEYAHAQVSEMKQRKYLEQNQN